jgi:molybdenum cofactor cytidylyltransferase
MIVALVPAAGRSQRMGRPKMLLPIAGDTLIGRVVTALREGGAQRVVAVTPPDDSDEGPAIAAAARGAGAEVVAPRIRPAEMRDSIEIGLETLAVPSPPSRVLLAPGDAAGITPGLVRRLLKESADRPERIIVPRAGSRRGHPVVLPWSIAAEVASLPKGQGASALLSRHQSLVVEIPIGEPHAVDDIDTPEDFRLWQERSAEELAHGMVSHVRLQVRFFALARERAGCPTLEVELTGSARVADLRAEIARRLPGLAPLMKNVMIAVDEEYANDDEQISPGARVAVIPPVSGGAGGQVVRPEVEPGRRGTRVP